MAEGPGRTVFFPADDGSHGDELWRTDGSPAGTRLVRDLLPGAKGWRPRWLTSWGGKLYFAATDARHGRELWKVPAT